MIINRFYWIHFLGILLWKKRMTGISDKVRSIKNNTPPTNPNLKRRLPVSLKSIRRRTSITILLVHKIIKVFCPKNSNGVSFVVFIFSQHLNNANVAQLIPIELPKYKNGLFNISIDEEGLN